MATPYRRRRTTRRTRRSTRSGRPRRRMTARRQSKRRVATPCKCPGELTPSAKFAMSQLDPFDLAVTGAKIPDSNTIPSISNTDVDIIPLTSLSNGSITAWAFRPQYTWAVLNTSYLPGPPAVITWGATLSAQAQNRTKRERYVAQCELTRPVAHAIRISSPVAPTAATGFVHLGLATESIFGQSTWAYPTTVSQMAGLQFYKRVTLASLTQSPLTVINKWIDETGFRYSAPQADQKSGVAAEFQTDYGWAAIIVMAEGVGIDVNFLSVEHMLISEAIPQRDAVFIGSTAAPNSPGTMAAVSQMATTQEPFHTEAEQESYIARGVNAVAQGAAAAGQQVFSTVAAPLLQRFGSSVVNAGANALYYAATGRGGIVGVNSNPNRLALHN